MRWATFLRGFARAFFVLYCVEAGLFLTLAPWRSAWPHLLMAFPVVSLRNLLLDPVARGAISGFGLVHLVWGFHDLRELLRSRRRPTTESELPR
jgi:hypothetical protein